MSEINPSMSALFVVCHFPDFETARIATETLIEKRLAACGNILDGCTSIFRWEGKVQIASEIPVFYKTTLEHYAEFEAALLELHPYDVPEIVALPIDLGLLSYIQWIKDQVGNPIEKTPNAPSTNTRH